MKFIQYFHSATGWLAIALFLRLGSGILLLPLILRYVPENQLGLWYVFLSVGNAAVMIDLGFSKTAIRSVSALWAGAGQLTAQGVALADRAMPNYGGVRDLLAAMRLLYLLMALVVAIYLIIADYFLIPWGAVSDLTPNSPRFAWYVYAAGQVVTAYTRWQIPVLTGIGKMRLSQQYVAASTVIYLGTAAFLLVIGYELLGIAIGQLVQIVLGRILFANALKRFVPVSLTRISLSTLFSIVSTIWPNTWRHGCMILSGTLVASTNTLIVANQLGLEQASRFGLSQQLFGLLEQLAGILVAAKIADLTALQVQGKLDAMRRMVLPRLSASWLLFSAGAFVIILIGPSILHLLDSKTSLLAPAALQLFAAERFFQFNQNQHVRLVVATNRIPFLTGYIVSMLLVPPLAWFGASYAGIMGLIAANFIVQWLYNNPVSALHAANDLGFGVMEYYRAAIMSLAEKFGRLKSMCTVVL